MLTSWSEQSTPAELSIASVLMRPPASAYSMRPRCVSAEVAALADDARAQLAAVDADRVVGAVADLGVRLVGGLHEGADAAVPEQVDRRAQDRRARARPASSVSASTPSAARTSGESGTDFALRGNTPPPAEISVAVVVGPRRARAEREQPLAARRTSAAGSGVGSRKTWRWSKAATSRIWSRAAACRCRTRRPTCRRCRRP